MGWYRKPNGIPMADLRKYGHGRRSILTPALRQRYGLAPPDDVCEAEYQEILTHAREYPEEKEERKKNDIPRLCEWYATTYKAGSPDGTRATVRVVLKCWQAWCTKQGITDPMHFDSIGAQDYAGYLLNDGRTLGGVKNYLAVVRAVYNAAVAVGLLKACPVTHWPKLPKSPPKVHHYTPAQVREILAAVHKHANAFYPVVLFLASTGWSVSDACDLRHTQIDLERKCANRRRKKSGTAIMLPLNSTALEAIRLTDTTTNRVFLRKNGEPLKSDDVWHALQRAKKAAGIAYRVNPHSFRHTVAVELTRRGTPLAVVAQILGHDPKTTLLYYQEFQPGSGAPYLDSWAMELDGTAERHSNVTPFRRSL